ncbi:MAG: phosphoribosylformylglycinamidine cyclo-ligase [Candidatus Krumholzibacteriota bacterium]|nr:phosphoribosylformylglycinamidine cyclo-ligase [Candidatus Krumholzibacteriota bacterium]
MKYRDSGVDIDRAGRALKRAGGDVKSTWNARVLSGLGAFGGLFDAAGFTRPVLVSSIDGVGTKLKVAFAAKRHDTVGACLVNHCVNDILVQGARPLFFLDYFATGRLAEDVLVAVLAGMAGACKANGCALIGGETAEMPGFYPDDEYDLAGCIVGVVDREQVVDGRAIRPGDLLVGLASTGLHTNGYSLARRVLLDGGAYALDDRPPQLGGTLADALLAVHRSYLSHVGRVTAAGVTIKGMVHLTGGAFLDNIPRILPAGCAAAIDTRAWLVPPLFELIASAGGVAREEMYRVFNMGVGFVLVVDPADAPRIDALGLADCLGVIGRVEAGAGGVRLEP